MLTITIMPFNVRKLNYVSDSSPGLESRLNSAPLPPPKVMGGYDLALVDIYLCEQLLGANSSPIVTKLGQSYHYPRDEGQGCWGGMRSAERPSSYKTKLTGR